MHIVMHNVMRIVMHNVMHNVMHIVMHSVMHNVMHNLMHSVLHDRRLRMHNWQHAYFRKQSVAYGGFLLSLYTITFVIQDSPEPHSFACRISQGTHSMYNRS